MNVERGMTTRFSVVMAVFAVAATVLLWSALHFAGNFGSAHGVIVDAVTGKGIEDATVDLFAEIEGPQGPATKVRMTVESGAEGAFVFRSTLAGPYRLTVTRKGYEALVADGVVIAPQEKKDLGKIALKPAK